MKPVAFNCKSELGQRDRERCAPPLIRSPALLGHLFFLSTFSVLISLQSIYYESLSSSTSCRGFYECFFYNFQVFSNVFYPGYDDSHPAHLPSLHLTASSPADHFSRLSLSAPTPDLTCLSFLLPFLSLFLSLPGSLREPAYTINVSWQHATSSPRPGQL